MHTAYGPLAYTHIQPILTLLLLLYLLLSLFSERVSAIAENNSSAAAAASEQTAAAQAQLTEGAAERDGLVFLTNKYYDMLTKQQVRGYSLVLLHSTTLITAVSLSAYV
jgi:hypothetical protein